MEALKELRETGGPGLLQKIMAAAGGAIERILGKLPDPQAAPAAAEVGDKVKVETSGEAHTQYIDDAGVPMMASTPRPLGQRIDDWKKYASEQPPAVQAKVAGELTRATQLTALVADLAKKAKTDPAAKSQLATAQKDLAASMGNIQRQIPPEPEKKPAPPAAASATPGAPGAKAPARHAHASGAARARRQAAARSGRRQGG